MEERYGEFRIGQKDPFEIIILAEFQHYKIAVNGCHLGVFRHRFPLHLVQYIHVHGDVAVEHILLEQDMKAAQESAQISSLIGIANSSPYNVLGSSTSSVPSTYHVIGTSTSNVPSSYQVIGTSTSNIAGNYHVIGTSSAPSNYQAMPSAPQIHSTYEPPPPYPGQQPQQPQPQQPQTWVFRKM